MPLALLAPLLFEQNYEWVAQRGSYMSLKSIVPLSDDPIVKMPAVAT
jgi:putative transposase